MLKKSFLPSVLIALLLISSYSCLNHVGATEFNGIVSSDTTWTQAKNPYTLTGPVLVNNGVTLTIEPGVTVNFNSNYLIVNGTLNARGTSENKIIFQINEKSSSYPAIKFDFGSANWNEQTNSGCIIENAVIHSAWMHTTIQVYGAAVKINNDIIDVGLKSSSNIAISVPVPNAFVPANPTIISNCIIGSGECGIDGAVNCLIYNNTIYNCVWGIDAEHYSGSEVRTWHDNTIYGCDIGVNAYTAAVNLEKNLITDNDQGIAITRYHINQIYNSTIQYNTISKNSIGIYLEGQEYPTIKYNNIQNNNQSNIRLENRPDKYDGGTANIDATSNWWGTTDSNAIKQTIHDYTSDYNVGNVTFTPFLTSPNQQAPADIYTPISSISPTAAPISTSTPSNTEQPTTSSTPDNINTLTPSPTSEQTETATPQQGITNAKPLLGLDWQTIVVVILAVIMVLLIVLIMVKHRNRKK